MNSIPAKDPLEPAAGNTAAIWNLLKPIVDPEIPVLSIIELGMIRDIQMLESVPEVIFTPTYPGCPAINIILGKIRALCDTHGYRNLKITIVSSPAWTTDWLSEEVTIKLKGCGFAPPNPKQQVCNDKLYAANEAVPCPYCSSWHTHRISEFGSRACTVPYQCGTCQQSFDYFKCH